MLYDCADTLHYSSPHVYEAGKMLMPDLKGPLCSQHNGENHLTKMQPCKIVFSPCLMLSNTLN